MSHNSQQTMFSSNNPFSLLDVDDGPESTDYPVIEARKIMSDEEQRTAGTVLVPWAGYAAYGQMIRTLSQIWAQSGEAVSAFVENIFESEYLGNGLKAFEGLPAWAVPLPEDFDEEKHVGWATHKYVLARRLHVCVEIDPSPKQAWLKPVLDTTMENWIRDPKKRLYGVNKLWEAYDFFCYWALEVARTGITCPLLFSLDNYTQDHIRKLRLSVSERAKLYEECVGTHVTGTDEGWVMYKGKGKETTTTNVKPAFKDGKPNNGDEDARSSSVATEPYGSKWHGHKSSNPPIRHQPGSTSTVPSIPTPRQQFSFTRPRAEQSNSISPPPAPSSTPQEKPFKPGRTEPKTPEDAIAQMAEATRTGVRANSFKAWSHFFETQLARHDELSRGSAAWPTIDLTFQRFLQELCVRFPPADEGRAAELQQWARAASKRVEDYKAERAKYARADAMLDRVMGLAADLKE
ncbi:hypothetical protein F5Y00DRAFT_270873 [Daldinia vernicosa]|uniref:uncharacterized protein n=1 Tax=Daldinia vernicosa TaxID=114800 RepID=UPI00200851D9|nr:uncharacterized protein F5Y00DRAFT_270873 [Daldinia vernicosa]KAI0847962.1 hypothetical protein F5Y00DRAFT_270873 [Daldinia vernicosa]